MKKHFLSFLYFAVASLALAPAARAETTATFNVYTPYYYAGSYMYTGTIVTGNFGPFVSGESMSSSTTYVLNGNVPDGYGISKWELRPSGGSKVLQSQTGGTSFSVTFSVKWKQYGSALDLIVYLSPITYTLSYNANGGSWTAGEPQGGTYEYNQSVTAAGASVVEREDYTFKGWKASGGSLIEAGKSFSGADLGITKSGSVVLYAQWEVKTYTYEVSLAVPEGASVKGLSKASSDEDWDYYKTTYVAGKGLTLPKATKTGSTFVAWYDNPNFVEDSDAKLYSKVTKIGKDETGDKEYYAKFETKLAIHYDGNGSSKGTMKDQEFVSGESISLTRNAFEKVYTVKFKLNGASGTAPANQTADYTFAHWNTEKDGTGDSYEDGQSVTFDKEESVTLHAQWEEEKDAITLPSAPTWSGHSFSGWYTQQSGGTRVGYGGDKYAPTGNITLYAQWDGQGDLSGAVGLENATLTTWCTKKSTYKGEDNVWREDTDGSEGEKDTCLVLDDNLEMGATSVLAMSVTGPGDVTFKACVTGIGNSQPLVFYNGTSNETITVVAEYKEMPSGEEIPAWTNITRTIGTGAVQVKWSVSSVNNQIWLDDIRWTPTGKEGKYTITAEPSDYAGGTVTGGGTYASGKTATLKAKPKTGWKFIGWKKDGEMVSTDNPYAVMVTADATYTAVLADEWYYISYNKNGGTGTMDKQLAVRDEDTTLTANAFTRANYTFAGWNTAKDGSGTAYADKGTVRNLALSGSTATLYAVWKSGSDPEPGPGPEPTPPAPTPEPGPYASAVGEAVSVDLAADCAGYTIKSVSGLPAGLKYSTKTGLVTGTPTKAVSKEDNVTITFTDKTKAKATWTVEPLPPAMVGTYYGAAEVGGTAGQFQLKLTAAGKATGYFYAAGKKVSLKSTALAAAGKGYAVAVSYTYDKAKCADEIFLAKAATVEGAKGDDVDIWAATVSGSEAMEKIDARRDVVKEVFGKVVPKATTYDVLEKTDEGEYLKAKVTTAGKVTVSGKLLSEAGTLASVSCSTNLIVDDEGKAYCWITIYKAVGKTDWVERCYQWYLP